MLGLYSLLSLQGGKTEFDVDLDGCRENSAPNQQPDVFLYPRSGSSL